MPKKKQEETYRITLKGLLWMALQDDQLAIKVTDGLELYLRRHHMKKPGDCGAIVFDGKGFNFTTVRLTP